jgi:hypothetical protein
MRVDDEVQVWLTQTGGLVPSVPPVEAMPPVIDRSSSSPSSDFALFGGRCPVLVLDGFDFLIGMKTSWLLLGTQGLGRHRCGRRLPDQFHPAGRTAGTSMTGLLSIFRLLSSLWLLKAGALGNTAPPEALASADSESSTEASAEVFASESVGLDVSGFFDPVIAISCG